VSAAYLVGLGLPTLVLLWLSLRLGRRGNVWSVLTSGLGIGALRTLFEVVRRDVPVTDGNRLNLLLFLAIGIVVGIVLAVVWIRGWFLFSDELRRRGNPLWVIPNGIGLVVVATAVGSVVPERFRRYVYLGTLALFVLTALSAAWAAWSDWRSRSSSPSEGVPPPRTWN
jgi:hypothetical protein